MAASRTSCDHKLGCGRPACRILRVQHRALPPTLYDGRLMHAPPAATSLAEDARHAVCGMVSAEPHLPTGLAVLRALDAPAMVTSLAAGIHHAILGVFSTKLRLPTVFAVRWLPVSTIVTTLLADVHHLITGVFSTKLRLPTSLASLSLSVSCSLSMTPPRLSVWVPRGRRPQELTVPPPSRFMLNTALF